MYTFRYNILIPGKFMVCGSHLVRTMQGKPAFVLLPWFQSSLLSVVSAHVLLIRSTDTGDGDLTQKLSYPRIFEFPVAILISHLCLPCGLSHNQMNPGHVLPSCLFKILHTVSVVHFL
jgi:hypothetical protein